MLLHLGFNLMIRELLRKIFRGSSKDAFDSNYTLFAINLLHYKLSESFILLKLLLLYFYVFDETSCLIQVLFNELFDVSLFQFKQIC